MRSNICLSAKIAIDFTPIPSNRIDNDTFSNSLKRLFYVLHTIILNILSDLILEHQGI